MNVMSGTGAVASPTRSPEHYIAYENVCRDTLHPWVNGLLNMADSAGWNRRTAALTLMFLAARYASAAWDSGEEWKCM
jgi:hypothetical protein